MSNRLFGLLLVVAGVLSYLLFSFEPPTNELWRAQAPGDITTPPAQVGETFCYLIRQQQLGAIDATGKLSGPVPLPSQARHPLVGLASGVLVADRSGGYTCYSADLKERWKRATLTPSDLSPLPIPGNLVVVSGAHEVLFAVDADTGEQVWESHFDGRVVHLVSSETIGVVYGYDDLKKPSWKLCAIDPADGSLLWTYRDPVEDAPPFVYGGYFIFCDATGRPVAVDQETGEIVYRHESEGYKIATVTGHSLLILANGGTRLDCSDLPTGKSWSVLLSSPFLAAHAVGDAILFADGRGIKCLEATTGFVRWQRELGKTFDAFVHRNGLGITYKDNFLARQTQVTLFTADANRTLWSALDKSRFYKPMALSNADLIVCRSGNIRLLPLPATTPGTSAVASASIEVPIDTTFWQILPGQRPATPAVEPPTAGKPASESAPPTASAAGWE
ncbi:MAG TPA: PQQ-binding-like beta-propeller repeat protein [Candidatus Ozemobacteraceae bacterium]|nr:PQQ-binding-like beta-propeller repeat protein [Candidatus Ozemobacteraceae bacterium]